MENQRKRDRLLLKYRPRNVISHPRKTYPRKVCFYKNAGEIVAMELCGIFEIHRDISNSVMLINYKAKSIHYVLAKYLSC